MWVGVFEVLYIFLIGTYNYGLNSKHKQNESLIL